MHLRKRLEGAVFATIIGGAIVFVVRAGGDWMPGWRFMVPVLPILVVLQCYGLLSAQRWFEQRNCGSYHNRKAIYWNSALVSLEVFAFAICPHSSWAKSHFSTKGEDILITSEKGGLFWVGVGNYIHDSLPSGSHIAYSEMGYAGFVNLDKYFIDTRGLTDHEIACLPNKYKGSTGVNDLFWTTPDDPLYKILRRRRPDFILSRDGGEKHTVLQEYGYVALDTEGRPEMRLLQVYRRVNKPPAGLRKKNIK